MPDLALISGCVSTFLGIHAPFSLITSVPVHVGVCVLATHTFSSRTYVAGSHVGTGVGVGVCVLATHSVFKSLRT